MDLVALSIDALQVVLWVGAPALAACTLAGLFSGLLQSATFGDAALSFVPRWLAVVAALFLAREFMVAQLVGFTARMLREMAGVGG